jgi:hypothetical protein
MNRLIKATTKVGKFWEIIQPVKIENVPEYLGYPKTIHGDFIPHLRQEQQLELTLFTSLYPKGKF